MSTYLHYTQSTSSLLFTQLTAYSKMSGCPQFQLDGDPCLRIFTHFSSSPGGDKDRQRAVRGNSHYSILAETIQESWAFLLTYQLCSPNDQISCLNPSLISCTQIQTAFISQPGCCQTLPHSSWPFRESYSPGSQ